jgi:flagellin
LIRRSSTDVEKEDITMALVVNTNVASSTAQMYVNQTNRDMADTMARLSSGKRINTAADDAAGVAISSRLTAEVRGTNQAIRNALDAQAMIDTAEGAHSEVENILQRMREIAVQAANDTNSTGDRTNLQTEMTALTDEINRIAATTTWANVYLLNGDGADGAVSSTADATNTFNFQVSSDETGSLDTISATMKAIDATSLGVGGSASAATVAFGTLTAADSTASASVTASGTITLVAETDAAGSSGTERFTFTVDGGSTLTYDFYDDGVDKGYDTTTLSSLAASFEQFLEDNLDTNKYSFSVTGGAVTINKANSVSVASTSAANSAMTSIDAAISELNTQRASLGAQPIGRDIEQIEDANRSLSGFFVAVYPGIVLVSNSKSFHYANYQNRFVVRLPDQVNGGGCRKLY